MDAALVELTNFLQQEKRPELKHLALKTIAGLTTTEDGLKAINQCPNLLEIFLENLDGDKLAGDCLINITANETGASELLKLNPNAIDLLIKTIKTPDSKNADNCCMILSNLTRTSENVEKVIDCFISNCDDLIAIFTQKHHNKTGATFHHLGSILANLSQNFRFRKHILNHEKRTIERLLSFISYPDSVVRRKGVVATIKNCTFDVEHHEWLLSENVDILPYLLLPLADNTEFDDDDNEKLPIELQFLPEDKQRESDPEIRKMLLEAITQLCAKKTNREQIRNKNAYVILRELHKSEGDEEVKIACENLVDILIRNEDEIGAENLKDVEIPDDIQQKFNENK